MNKEIQIRQGDIFLLPSKDAKLSELSEDIKISKLKKIAENSYTLAYGETTGNSHVMKGNVNFYDNGNGQVLCQVRRKTEIVHEEHDKIEIPEGDYLVIHQREYDILNGIRRVMD